MVAGRKSSGTGNNSTSNDAVKSATVSLIKIIDEEKKLMYNRG